MHALLAKVYSDTLSSLRSLVFFYCPFAVWGPIQHLTLYMSYVLKV